MKRLFGFTLVELLIGMFLLAVLLTATLSLFLPQLRLSSISQNISDTQKDALTAHILLTQELSQSSVRMLSNNTNLTIYSLPSAISFPIAYDADNFHYASPTTPPAPIIMPTDPLTGAPILEKVPAWNAFVVYFVDSSQTLWRVKWPACGCNGLVQCGGSNINTLSSCSDLLYPTPSPDPDTQLYFPRISGTALQTVYATSTPASGATARALAKGVLALELFSGDSDKPTTQYPVSNPVREVLLVKRSFGQYNPANPANPNFENGNNLYNPAIGRGDTVMILDSSINTSVGNAY